MNKPRYSLIANLRYALNGVADVYRHETIFRIEVWGFFPLSFIAWLLPIPLTASAILQISLFFPLFAELINSAIERTVDLTTREEHHLAKSAKDAAAAACLVSVIVTALTWLLTLYVTLF